ncbi:MAG TPA: PAS domain S-box protein [Burkholderiaceae bacterium]|nr:PAS domain S-box protein [Burkholderiaceae bacterium]
MDKSKLIELAVEQTRDYALFVLDPNGNILTWNTGAQAIKGYRPDEILGRHFSVFYTHDAIQRGWPTYELTIAAAEGRFEDEGWRLRKGGSRFWANVIITAIRDNDGTLVGFSKVTRDLSQRKAHEDALQQSEERFRLLVEGVQDYAIFMLDSQGLISSWNKGAQRIIDYSANEIIGKHFSRFFSDEDIKAHKPWEELATARRDGRFEGEGWRLKKDGSRFWARSIVTALFDSAGQLRGFAKVTQDLSERRHIQALESAARNVNEFIAVLAHEIRNPLAPIQTAVQVIANSPKDAPERDQMYDVIRRQTSHLRRIADDLLDITRLTRGEMAIEHKPVDLSEVADEATKAIALDDLCKHHRLELNLAPEKLQVLGDAHRLSQLLSNLLTNACKYTPPGGLICVTTRVVGADAEVEVKDSGRGIERAALDDIFEMFVQQSPVIERAGAGLGIGLALSRKIAEMHRGTLVAESEGPNKGSVFTFRMPRAAQVHAAPPKIAPRVTLPEHLRILIVDDNADAATTLNMLMTSLGYETCVVATGWEALQSVSAFNPNVVLLDIGLPGIDGYEVARRLRAMKPNQPIKIVAVTGWGQEADKQKSRAAGIDVHLVKPVDAAELRSALAANGTLH